MLQILICFVDKFSAIVRVNEDLFLDKLHIYRWFWMFVNLRCSVTVPYKSSAGFVTLTHLEVMRFNEIKWRQWWSSV